MGKKYRKQLKKEHPKTSSAKLNEKRDDFKKEYKKEMGEYIELFMAFRDQQMW